MDSGDNFPSYGSNYTSGQIKTVSADYPGTSCDTTYSYSYDANGNTTEIYRNNVLKNSYEYDELGQDLTDKDVIIVDDMISSGDSFFDVARQIKSRGAKRIFAFDTFGLFTSGFDKFDEAYRDGLFDRIFTTNLVYTDPAINTREWYVCVNMCKYLSYIIDTLNHDETISHIIDPVKKIHALLERHREETGGQMKIDFTAAQS